MPLKDEVLTAYEEMAGDPLACQPECRWRTIVAGLLRHVRNGPVVPISEIHGVVAAFRSESESGPLCVPSACPFRDAARQLRIHALYRAAQQEAVEGYKRSGYLDFFKARLEAVCAPVIYKARDGRRHNGTMTFLDTGKATLGLTAAHVVEALERECSEANPFQVGSQQLSMGTFLGRHPELDLAAFALSTQFIESIGKRTMLANDWPPPYVEEGEVIAFAGYPGCERREIPEGFDMGFLFSIANAQSVSDRGFGAAMNFKTSFSADNPRFSEDAPLGGWSGGPAFRLKKEPVDEPELIGIIYSGHDTGIVQAHTLTSLARDGTFA